MTPLERLAQFQEENGYWIGGTWYPRVTKIISIKAKPALYRFYGNAESFENGKEIAERAAEEGTLIHSTAQALLLGKSPLIPQELAPAFQKLQEFLDTTPILTAPEHIERKAVHRRYRYAGTADALVTIGGKFGVLDIKTSSGIFREFGLQTAAYLAALKEEFPSLATRWILRIDQVRICEACNAMERKKGGARKITLKRKKSCPEHHHQWTAAQGIVELRELPYWQYDFNAFLSAKHLWEWEYAYWLRKIGYFD
ncbi:hypothetical protein D6833_10395 [Candidatus Parcubacteria bacterium]|nr:MAG: hypothetical protein D6833_10395 [Candidatus Parcubacteria bacterium]